MCRLQFVDGVYISNVVHHETLNLMFKKKFYLKRSRGSSYVNESLSFFEIVKFHKKFKETRSNDCVAQ